MQNVIRLISISQIYITDAFIAILLDACSATMMWKLFVLLVTSQIITLRMQLVNVSFVHLITAKHAVHFYSALNAKLLFPLMKQQKPVTLIIRMKIVRPDSI